MKWHAYTLLLCLVLAGSSLMAFGSVGGIFVFAGVFALAIYIRFSPAWSPITHFVVALPVLFLIALLLPPSKLRTKLFRLDVLQQLEED